ncbi:hypothetical protein HanRHA438_Chr14g0665441 [Helianthus annuus]|nr:hypothetical protein HanRHA438_Chr14g0665441 [Helianthus annuus]
MGPGTYRLFVTRGEANIGRKNRESSKRTEPLIKSPPAVFTTREHENRRLVELDVPSDLEKLSGFH